MHIPQTQPAPAVRDPKDRPLLRHHQRLERSIKISR
jgi:hypothetical protein